MANTTNIRITARDETKIAFDSARQNVEKLTSGVSTYAKVLTGAGAALLGVNSALDAFNQTLNELAALDDLNQKTGASVENLSRFQKVAKAFGQDFGEVDAVLVKFSRSLAGNDENSKKAREALAKLGVSSKDSSGVLRDSSDVLLDAARKLQGYKDGNEKAALATMLLGKSGANLIPYLNDLSENFEKFQGASARSAAQAAAFQDQLGILKVRASDVAQSLTEKLIPGLSELLGKFTQNVQQSGLLLGSLKGIWDFGELVIFGTEQTQRAERMKTLVTELANLERQLNGQSAQAGKNGRFNGIWMGAGEAQRLAMQKSLELAQLARESERAKPAASPGTSSGKATLSIPDAEDDAAAKKLISSYDSLIKKSQEYLVALQYENAEGEKLSAGQKQIAELRDFLTQNTSKLTQQQMLSIGESIRDIAITDEANSMLQTRQERIAALVEWQIKQNEAQTAHTEGLLQATRAYDDMLASTNQQIKSVDDQINTLKYGVKYTYEAEAARHLEAAAAFEQSAAYAAQNGVAQENIQSMLDRAAALRKLADAQYGLADKNKELKVLQAQKDYAKQFGDTMSRSLTDALFRGFESGKSFIDNFKDTLKNAFQTLVLRPTIEMALSPITRTVGGLAGSIFAGSAFAAGESGGIPDISGGLGFGNIKSLFDALNGNLVDSITGLGAKLANGMGGLRDTIGGFMGQYGSQIATGLAFAPSVISLLRGDVKGAAFSGAGAGLGMYLGGPAGAAIGSVLGSLAGGLFGGEANPRYTGQFQSVYGANGLIRSGQVNADGKDTSVFNSNLGALNNQFAKSLEAVYGLFNKDIKRLTLDSIFSYKPGKQTIGGLIGNIDGNRFVLGSQGYGEDSAQGFAAFANKVMTQGLQLAIKSSTLPRDVKKYFDGALSPKVFQSLVNSVGTMNAVLDVFDDRLGTTTMQMLAYANRTGKNARQRADIVSGISGDLTSFYDLFYSDTEKLADATKSFNKQFAEFGLQIPDSTAGFRDYVEQLSKKNDEESQSLLVKLLDVAPAFKQYLDALDAQKEKLEATAEALTSDRFATLFDYEKAQRFIAEGRSTIGLPGFAVGTNYVPADMPAIIHQGERIIPAADNKELMSRLRAPQSSNKELLNAVSKLTQEVSMLRAEARSSAISNSELLAIVERLRRDGFPISGWVDDAGNLGALQVEVVTP